MPASIIPAFLYYSFINGITPGPANLCSLSASMNFGRKRALIQWTGIFAGFAANSFLALLLCYFLGSALGERVTWIRCIGAGYIIWLAVKLIITTKKGSRNEKKDCNFLTGFLVNLLNVKTLLYCITALSAYVLPYSQSFGSLLAVAVFLPFTGPICNLAWLFAGDRLRTVFDKHPLACNLVMAVSLVICAIRILIG